MHLIYSFEFIPEEHCDQLLPKSLEEYKPLDLVPANKTSSRYPIELIEFDSIQVFDSTQLAPKLIVLKTPSDEVPAYTFVPSEHIDNIFVSFSPLFTSDHVDLAFVEIKAPSSPLPANSPPLTNCKGPPPVAA